MTSIMTMRLIGILATLAVTLSLPAPVSAAEMRVLPHIVVDGDTITLADMFGDIGPAGKGIVSRAPAPGKRLSVTIARLRRAARDQGLDWRPIRGMKSISVRRVGYRIPAAEIEAVIIDALMDEMSGGRLSIQLNKTRREIFVASSAVADLEIENLSLNAYSGRFVASLIIAAGTDAELQIEFRGRATEMIELPMLNKAIKRGEIISDGDIELIEWQVRRTRRDTITDIADMVGLAARRTLRAGRPLRERDVHEPVIVAKGASVSLVYRTRNMVLTAGGKALEDGVMGSIIRILNSQSKIIVQARVVGGNILSVTSGVTSLAMN